MCIYEIATKKVVEIRGDNSAPQTMTCQDYVNDYCACNKKQTINYAFAEIEPLEFDLYINKHIYDAQTNTVIVSPDWIEPPRVETSSIPVSNPSGGV
jgi:hypothetical protein